jgi:hypothetical protein
MPPLAAAINRRRAECHADVEMTKMHFPICFFRFLKERGRIIRLPARAVNPFF